MMTGMNDRASYVIADMRRRIIQQEHRMQGDLRSGTPLRVAVDRRDSIPEGAAPGTEFYVVSEGRMLVIGANGAAELGEGE